ncbi:MAG TPA: hypothetical protein VF704_08940 [Allosphingosinicella sp.]|jgi:hypothetical protein
MGVLIVVGILLIALGFWGFRRPGGRARYSGIGFMLGGAIALLVAVLAMAGLIRE